MFWLERKETARQDLAKSKHYRELPRKQKRARSISNLHGDGVAFWKYHDKLTGREIQEAFLDL